MRIIVAKSDSFNSKSHQSSCEEQPQQIFESKRELKFWSCLLSLNLGELIEQRWHGKFIKKYYEK